MKTYTSNFNPYECCKYVDFKALYPTSFIRIVEYEKKVRWKDKVEE